MNKYTVELLSEIGADSKSKLSFDNLKTVFLMAVRDFKDGKLKLEDLSLFASDIVQMPDKHDSSQMAELKETIHLCSEIGYYLHQIPEVDKDGKNTIEFLLQAMNYYEKNKELLQK